MTDKNEEKKDEQIYKKGEKYHCAECHSEIPIKQACPTCGKEIDWDRIRFETRIG